MLITITRIVDRLGETVDKMRATLAEHGFGGATSPYRADFAHISMSVPEYARLRDQLAEARRTIEQDAEREANLERRISELSSSNGALMVDRDRGIREAGQRADGARLVAADLYSALLERGHFLGVDLDTLIEDGARYYYATLAHYERESERLDAFRCSMVGLIQQCQTQAANGKGLTPEQVGKLGRAIHRANNKALGR